MYFSITSVKKVELLSLLEHLELKYTDNAQSSK